MPKKLPGHVIAFRQRLEEIRKQFEEGPANDQSRRIEYALIALKDVRNDIDQLGRYVDNIIVGLSVDDSNATDQPTLPPMDTKDDVVPPPFNENAPDLIDNPQEELFPAEVKG